MRVSITRGFALCLLSCLSGPALAAPKTPQMLFLETATPFLVPVQSVPPSQQTPDSPEPIPGPDSSGGGSPPVRDATTGAITESIGQINTLCELFPREVEISCIADRYRTLARQLPASGDYAPVREVLEAGAAQLDRIARANAAPNPPRRYMVNRPGLAAPVQTAPLVAIAPARLRSAESAARDVIDQMETVLLRSAENSRRRAVHFQDIAAAIDSNKVLLRS